MSELLHDFEPGVIVGADVQRVFALAKAAGYAIPAVNVTGTNTMNAVMESAVSANAPVVIQFSHGGAAFIAGGGLATAPSQAAVIGAVSGATHVHTVAKAYGARVILQTDHAPRSRLGWIDRLLEVGAEHMAATGSSLFSAHMLDLSGEPLNENIETCCGYLERLSTLGMTLEIELGITGGEEDGVDNTTVDSTRLFTNPEDVLYAFRELSKISDQFTIAASFGNVHGVYQPGDVQLRPTILRDSQDHVQRALSTGPAPVDFVFHGGSGSSSSEIREAISYGVVKMNINTDLEWAFWNGVRGYADNNHDYLQSQIGNPADENLANKDYYEPRTWLRSGEESLVERMLRAFEQLGHITAPA